MEVETYQREGQDRLQGDDDSEPAPYDVTGAIIAYEAGELDVESTVELFQHLVDTGLAWQLQGHYGRTARSLIDAGHVNAGQSH